MSGGVMELGRSAASMREEGSERLKVQLRRDLGQVICAALDERTTTEVVALGLVVCSHKLCAL